MTNDEIGKVLAALERADKAAHAAITSALYEIAHMVKHPKPVIDDDTFNEMWTRALGRMTEGSATIVQARHLLREIETYYGIQRQ